MCGTFNCAFMFLTFWLLKEGFVFSQGSRLISFDEIQIHSSRPLSAKIENFCTLRTIAIPKDCSILATFSHTCNILTQTMGSSVAKGWLAILTLSGDDGDDEF